MIYYNSVSIPHPVLHLVLAIIVLVLIYCCSLCKVLDLVILEQYAYGKYIYTLNLHCDLDEVTLQRSVRVNCMETVTYFVQRHSDVFSCLLDASKAFDKVHYGKLFQIVN